MSHSSPLLRSADRGEARSGPPLSRRHKGKTVGISVYGNIANAMISRLAGWDARILVSNRSKLPAPPGVAQCDLDTLIAESDIVLPLLPLTPETDTLLSRSEERRVGKECVSTCSTR